MWKRFEAWTMLRMNCEYRVTLLDIELHVKPCTVFLAGSAVRKHALFQTFAFDGSAVPVWLVWLSLDSTSVGLTITLFLRINVWSCKRPAAILLGTRAQCWQYGICLQEVCYDLISRCHKPLPLFACRLPGQDLHQERDHWRLHIHAVVGCAAPLVLSGALIESEQRDACLPAVNALLLFWAVPACSWRACSIDAPLNAWLALAVQWPKHDIETCACCLQGHS